MNDNFHECGSARGVRTLRFGYYSALAVDESRRGLFPLEASCWKSPVGEEVVVTYIGSTRKPADSGYCWSDAVCVGELVEYVGAVAEGDERLYGWDFLRGEGLIRLRAVLVDSWKIA